MHPSEPTNEIHYAGGEVVHLLVAPDNGGGWKATILSDSLAQAWFLESPQAANRVVRYISYRTFPKHVCCGKCRPLGKLRCRPVA